MSLLTTLFTVILAIVSVLLVLVVLMQKAKSDGAMSALGSSSMESTFGAETSNILFTATRNLAILFFAISFGLYLSHVYQSKHRSDSNATLPAVTAPANTAPATEPAPATPAPTNSEPKNP